MKNVKLARRQFWGSVFLFLLSIVLVFLYVKPQYENLEKAKHNHSQAYPALSALPLLKKADIHTSWKDLISAAFQQIGQETHVAVVSVQGDPGQAQLMDNLPPSIKSVPITLTVKGTYASCQQFTQKLISRFPQSVIRTMELKNIQLDAPLKTDQSPVLIGTYQLDLVARFE